MNQKLAHSPKKYQLQPPGRASDQKVGAALSKNSERCLSDFNLIHKALGIIAKDWQFIVAPFTCRIKQYYPTYQHHDTDHCVYHTIIKAIKHPRQHTIE